MNHLEFKTALSFTRIESVRIRKALKAHLVDGIQMSKSAEMHSVDKSLLSKRITRVKGVHFRLKTLHRNMSLNEVRV